MDGGHEVKPRLAEAVSRFSSKEIPCIFCKKLWESRLTIINDKREILGALEALGVKYESITGVLDYACYKCVYRINVIIDFRRLLERNINKTRANYYYALGNKDLCRKFLSNTGNEEFSNTTNDATSSCYNLMITDVRSEREPERTADFLFDCFNDPDMYSSQYVQERNETGRNSPSRLLEPLYETEFSEPANKYKNYNNLMARKSVYKCQFCAKIYKRPHYLRKHERKHRGKLIRRSSVSSSPYACERCEETFETRLLLKSHRLSHRNRIKCSYCSAEFYLKHDLDLHEAKCFGEISARDETLSVRTYNTRLRTKHSTYAETEGSIDDLDTLYQERMKDIDDWIGKVDPNQDWDSTTIYSRVADDDTASVHSFLSDFSCASTAYSTSTHLPESSTSSVSSARVEQHVSYEKPKVKRKSFPGNVEARSDGSKTRKSSQVSERLKRLEKFVSSPNEKEYSTPDWQRLRNSVKRKNKAKATHGLETEAIFYCQEPKCFYFQYTLQNIMEHDMQVHYQLPLYYCKECQMRFTRMDYLQYHMMDHPAKHHTCHLCNDHFDYTHELRYHLELHAIRSHRCPSCSKSFLKEAQLTSHMLEQSHFQLPNSRKTATVSYKYFDEPQPAEGLRIAPATTAATTTDDGTSPPPTPLNHNPKFTSYSIQYIPQPSDPLGKRLKFERLCWKLGDITNYRGGIAPSTLDVDVDLNAQDQGDEIPIAEDPGPASLECENDVQENEMEPATEDISQTEQNIINVATDTASTLDDLNLFSIESLSLFGDPDLENGLGDNNNESNTPSQQRSTRKKRKRSEKTSFTLPILLESPLPSYSDLSNTRSQSKRIRLLPYVNYSCPSRLPC